MWQVELHSRLGQKESAFELSMAFKSNAQRLVLFGPSGAGKTQTLMMMAGLHTPQQGRVVFKDKVLFDSQSQFNLPSRLRALGYVFQDYALFPHLTVRQNIGFALQQGWLNPSASHKDPSVNHWIEVFQLEAVASLYPEQISGGQRQRIGIARALYHNPDVLVLDEATSSLDTETEHGVMQAVQALQGNKTVIIVAHRLSTVEYCDRLYRLESSRIVDEGTFEEVMNRSREN